MGDLNWMAYLYINSKGQEVRRHSHSGGDLFRFCARKYKLARPDGWQERERRASRLFGIALESAVRFHHENGLAGGAGEFARLWAKLKDDKELTYTEVEQSWENLTAVGSEMMALYALRLPSLPFDLAFAPKFQVPYSKEVFPGTKLAGIEFVAYVDMVGVVQREHPLLPRLDLPLAATRRLFVDIKTSAQELDPTPGIVALDQQLRDYSWVTDIPDGAFLWFTKRGRGLKSGDRVTVLRTENSQGDNRLAGREQVVLMADDEYAFVADREVFDAFKDETSGLKGKALEARKAEWREKEAVHGFSHPLVTKQRLAFSAARFGLDDRAEAAAQVGHDIAQIAHAAETGFWPKQGGVRFPNNKCLRCEMRGICLKDDGLRDKLVFRTDAEWDIAAEAEAE